MMISVTSTKMNKEKMKKKLNRLQDVKLLVTVLESADPEDLAQQLGQLPEMIVEVKSA